jgi:hypothetical protein
MCTWYEPGNIEKFYRNRSPSFDTTAVVGFAAISETEARAWAFDLEVADGALGIDGGESGRSIRSRRYEESSAVCAAQSHSWIGEG